MYDLPYYKETNPERVRSFIDAHPFAFLIGSGATGEPVATQLPLFIEERAEGKFLIGHIMKRTDHHKAFLHNNHVLAVFNGPHTYVSGTWYSQPGIASTWNYMSVHVKGTIRFLDGPALEDVLQRVSLHFEDYNEASGTVFNNLPDAFKKRVMHAIVAFEVAIAELDTVFKLSQDRDYESYRNIIARLKAQDADGQKIAAEMEQRTREVFPDKK